MKYLSLSLLLLIVMMSCGNDEDTSATVNFKLKYGQDDLVMFNNFVADDGTMMRITDVKGFISDFTLIAGNESEVISDVKFIELGDAHSDEEEAAIGYNWTIESELASVNEVNFNIGVSNEINETVPADYSSSSDLSRTSEYWTNWGSFIFFKVEGNADFDGNGTFDSGENIVLHLGSESAFKFVDLNKSMSDNTIAIELDVEKIFEGYDLRTMPTIHTNLTDELRANIELLSTNISNSFQ